ncbi:protein LNK1-like isoform X2 [Bidens hawaiensis]|uniref:protein LNK1-like isoform X2 n=1 Tax=Bidens hawaiensis TaxID=980011 RepID=UPI00404A69D9
MSDLSLYELGDIAWDEFDRGDDHIVPHPTNARSSKHSSEGDNCRKLQHETTVLSATANLDASHTICQQKEEKDFKPLDKKKKMMEKESPSHASHGVFNGSCDGEIVKDMPNLASDDIRMEDDCFKSSYATSATGDNNSYSYPLAQVSQGDLCFSDNNCEDKESGELLYYNWSDIGNFEDVDKMLRSCDSSLGWFTSDQIEGTEEALKMDYKFQFPEPSGLKNILHTNHDSPESNNHRSSCISESKDNLNFKDQINMQKKQSKHNNQTEGNAKGSFYQISHPRSNDSRLSSNNKSDQNWQQFDYFGHIQGNTCYLPPDYLHQTTSVPMLSDIKSEQKGLKSHSPMGSSYASNQSSGEPSIDERKRLQGFQPLTVASPRQMDMVFQSSKDVLVSDEKQRNLLIKEHGTQRGIDGDQKQVDIGLLNVSESSSVSSELNEISLEATSFRQLKQAMEQLDLRTKLCIRDSLYRLARSAEQRHNNNPSLGSGATEANDLGGPLMSERNNNGFIDMETDTNPIDRSVAHLLFHRPSESLKLPTFPQKHNLNHGSILTESRVCDEKAASGSNDTRSCDRN